MDTLYKTFKYCQATKFKILLNVYFLFQFILTRYGNQPHHQIWQSEREKVINKSDEWSQVLKSDVNNMLKLAPWCKIHITDSTDVLDEGKSGRLTVNTEYWMQQFKKTGKGVFFMALRQKSSWKLWSW